MSVRITFREPQLDEQDDQPGKYRQQNFPYLTEAVDWIGTNIAERDRQLIKLWIDDIAITGATLEAFLRPAGRA